jgi:hypothetical protein
MTNIILSTSGNQGNISTFAGGIGNSVIGVSSTFSLGIYSFCQVRLMDNYVDNESGTFPDFPKVEEVFSQVGEMIDGQTYAISWVGSDFETLYRFAEEINRVSDFNVWVIGEDGAARFLPKP